MDDQSESPKGDVPLSALLAPSRGFKLSRGPVTPDGWVIFKEKLGIDAPSDKYIEACRREGLQIPEQKPKKLQGPIDAEDYPASLQIFYVRCAARQGDWRAMRGTKPTPAMQDLFVIARAKYLAWKARRDEEEAREEALPKFWFEIEPGRFVLAISEEKARAWLEEMKPVVVEHHENTHERFHFEIDTSKTCVRCKLRRANTGHIVCGNCISLGFSQ